MSVSRVHRIKGDWSKALALPSEDLCRELGQHDCFDFVHTIMLGGIDPYESYLRGEREASPSMRRLWWSELHWLPAERVMTVTWRGERYRCLVPKYRINVDRRNCRHRKRVRAYINRLYNRALLRMPTERALALKGFYETLTTIPGAESHARDWGVLTCFMVLTSTENLFY